MTVRLDPLQLITKANFPVAPGTVVAQDVGQIGSLNDFFFSTGSLNSVCVAPFNPSFSGYITYLDYGLSQRPTQCAQQDFIVTGRTSGTSHSWGVLDMMAHPSFSNCFTGAYDCYWLRGDGKGFQRVPDWNGEPNNIWNSLPGVWRGFYEFFAFSTLGYSAGEKLDIELPYPDNVPFAITNLQDAGGGKVTVTSPGHGYINTSWVTLKNTVHYDGNYAISNVTTNTFAVTATWVPGSAAVGQVWPKYDFNN